MILQHDPRPGRVLPNEYCLMDGDRIIQGRSKPPGIKQQRQKARIKRWQRRQREHRDGHKPRLELFKI